MVNPQWTFVAAAGVPGAAHRPTIENVVLRATEAFDGATDEIALGRSVRKRHLSKNESKNLRHALASPVVLWPLKFDLYQYLRSLRNSGVARLIPDVPRT
jgi:hypothetical protein